MTKIFRRTVLFGTALLLITAQRLPAPVEELTSSPTPSQTAGPAKTSGKKASTSTRPSSSAAKSVPASTPTAADTQRRAVRFAGKWSGTIQTVPWGPWSVALTVSADETSLTQQINTDAPLTAVARRNGEMLQARFPAGLTTISWSLTPLPDGATAQVRFQAFANDFTTIFHRAETR